MDSVTKPVVVPDLSRALSDWGVILQIKMQKTDNV